MKTLWIGAGTHSPLTTQCHSDGILGWHDRTFGQSLADAGDEKLASYDLDKVLLKDNVLLGHDTPITLEKFDVILFTWNYYHFDAHKDDATKFLAIEKFARHKYPGIRILNSIQEKKALHSKYAFFCKMRNIGLDDHIPQFEEHMSLPALLTKRKLRYPFLLRHDTDCEGMNSYMVRSLAELYQAWKKLRDYRRVQVAFIDTMTEYGCYCTYRIYMVGSTIWFAIPKISSKKWTAGVVPDSGCPAHDIYIRECEKIAAHAHKNTALLQKVQAALDIHTLALDVLIHDEKLIFLEAELKYGPDVDFIRDTMPYYNLSQQGLQELHCRLGYAPCSIKNILGQYIHERVERGGCPATIRDEAYFNKAFAENSNHWEYDTVEFRIARHIREFNLIKKHGPYGNIFEAACAAGVFTRYIAGIAEYCDARDISSIAIEQNKKNNTKENISYTQFDFSTRYKEIDYDDYSLIVLSDFFQYIKIDVVRNILNYIGVNSQKTVKIFLATRVYQKTRPDYFAQNELSFQEYNDIIQKYFTVHDVSAIQLDSHMFENKTDYIYNQIRLQVASDALSMGNCLPDVEMVGWILAPKNGV